MKDHLSYKEFRTAYIRNVETCKLLISQMDSIESNKKRFIVHKAYYLSGYIIEFAYKYCLFHHLKFKLEQNVYEWTKYDWKVHDYEKLKFIATREGLKFPQDLPFLGNSNYPANIKKLYNNWTVQMRYSLTLRRENSDIGVEDLKEYINLLEKLTNLITTKYS